MSEAPELESPPCPLCGNNEVAPLLEGWDRLHNLPGAFGIVRCTQCEFAFTRPRPKDIGAYYPATYSPHLKKDRRRRRHTFQRLMLTGFAGFPGRRWMARLLLWPVWPMWRMGAKYARVIPWTGQMRLFDFGCGAGNYLMRMRDLGATVAGMDMSDQAVAVCREKGLDVRQGTFPNPDIPDGTYDVVTLWHAIEHVPNPREVVAEVSRILKPRGLAVMGFQLFDGFASAWFRVDWYNLDLPRHLNHFEQPTIQRLLEEEGFVDVRLRFQRRRHSWNESFKRRYESTGNKLWGWLSRRNSICSLMGILCWIARRGDLGVALARKPVG